MAFARALAAECLKLRRTLALWLAPIAPLVIVALQIAIVLQRQEYYQQHPIPDPWAYYGEQTVFLWTLLMLPLFITLETALLANVEHSNQQWKHLFALPVPRNAVYVAKQISGMGIIGLGVAALYAYMVLSGLALRVVTPGLGFEAPVPWTEFLQYAGLTYLASWLIISLHTWVGLRWRSFVVASAVGIGAMVVGVVLFQSNWVQWYPWTLPGLIAYSLGEGLRPVAELAVGSLGGLAVALLGAWDVTRRDVL
jgi:hypothetical protein